MRFSVCARQLANPKTRYDAIVIGGGHNGLTAAAYLAKAEKKVCVLERRHVLGGAAVTEEIIPGFRFSRASYLLSLLRPVVIEELKLKDHGLRYHIRNPSSFTPVRDSNDYLLLGMDMKKNLEEIGKFSAKDAMNYERYEHFLNRVVDGLQPLMDVAPIDLHNPSKLQLAKKLVELFKIVRPIGLQNVGNFYELMTAPISKVMDKWFEGDVLKATLATDGVIGSGASPYDSGTGYVLLHHVLGGLDGNTGTWGYVFGGMGAVSEAIAKAARSHGAETYVDQEVQSIILDGKKAKGVRLSNGKEIHADLILSNATPQVTLALLDKDALPSNFIREIDLVDYTSPVTKINVAVKELPSFNCNPGGPHPHHQTTIHLNCENMQIVHDSAMDFKNGICSRKPMIEMTIPSVVDRSIVDGDGHVVLLFTQYTPYSPKDGAWDDAKKEQYAKLVFTEIDAYAPNFSKSIVGYEVLPPPELEKTFGLTGGNIFHGAISLDQLYLARPSTSSSNYSTPISGLFFCGSGAHPGGGVTGAPGRLGALAALSAPLR